MLNILTRPKIKIRISFLAQIRDHIRESEPPIFIIYYDIVEKSIIGVVLEVESRSRRYSVIANVVCPVAAMASPL